MKRNTTNTLKSFQSTLRRHSHRMKLGVNSTIFNPRTKLNILHRDGLHMSIKHIDMMQPNIQLTRYYSSQTVNDDYKEQLVKFPKVLQWVEKHVSHCKPKNVVVCDGSKGEYEQLISILLESGTLEPVNGRENCYMARSDDSDVARVEKQTFICTKNKEEAPKDTWHEPQEMRDLLSKLFEGSMTGRTMYVIPFVLGPYDSPFSRYGVEITDSAYVAACMWIMTRMGKKVWENFDDNKWVPCLHSVGKPLREGERDVSWPNNSRKYICHFPEDREIISFGSGFGGNAILAKKCFALRLASFMAKEEGWLAEHMVIIGITNPDGVKKYFAAAFPSSCGKTNLALLNTAKLPGWKVETVGDDIAWLRYGKNGKLYAINPENGFFGVAAGTTFSTNPIATEMISKNTIFTNVAKTDAGDIYWEGLQDKVTENITTWRGEKYIEGVTEHASHPNSRFCVPINECPTLDPNYESPNGVPIEGILFGGRRPDLVPLVVEAFDWEHGVFLGASINSKPTAAALDVDQTVDAIADPFAMKPFLGYNLEAYIDHWASMGKKEDSNPPKIFQVNWFRIDKEGNFIWPGFGTNIRVLEWIFNRCDENDDSAINTAIGKIPKKLNTNGMDIQQEEVKQLFEIDRADWEEEMERVRQRLTNLMGSGKLPNVIETQIKRVEKNLQELWDLD